MPHRVAARVSLAALLLPLSGWASVSDGDVIDQLPGLPAASARVEQIEAAALAAYGTALGEYDAHIRNAPFDVVQQLARCEFMSEFASTYEYASFVERIFTEAEECTAALAQRHPEHPEVLLEQLEQKWGEERLTQGEKLLDRMSAHRWTQRQIARLYVVLANAASDANDADTLDYALRALDADEMADVRLIAAGKLIERGDEAKALAILTAPIDGSDPTNAYWQAEKMKLLAQLGARREVEALYAKVANIGSHANVTVAQALRQVGLIDLARKELANDASASLDGRAIAIERFQLELEYGTAQQALDAYNTMRDQGWQTDPLAINRIALAFRSLALPWQPRDTLGFFAIGALIVAVGLIALAPLTAVHYRGLAVRARTQGPYPSGGWRLRDAWVAVFAFGVAQVVALCCAGPLDLLSAADGHGWDVALPPNVIARTILVQDFLALALLWPMIRRSVELQPSLSTNWTLSRSLLVGAGLGLAIRLPLLLATLARDTLPVSDDPLWVMMTELRNHLGLGAAVWVVAIAAPLIEEFVFRGVLLRALNAHVPFFAANTIQAALFSAMHLNAKASILLFGVGALLGWLTRASGGLAAPMALHSVFNLVAALILLT